MGLSALSKLSKPPIVEAVVDFDCDMPLDFDLRKEQIRIQEAVSSNYPTLEPIHKTDFLLNLTPGDATSEVSQSLEALRFRTSDGNQLIQYRNSGFSFNRLAPYTSFDEYAGEIVKRWEQFLQLAKPVVLRTLRLRYINSLSIPIEDGWGDFQKYLNCVAVLKGNGLESGEFLLRLNVADGSGSLSGIVVSSSLPPTKSHIPVTIDIAVQKDVTCELDDLVTIQKTLTSLRIFKNQIFASMITEALLQKLEEAK